VLQVASTYIGTIVGAGFASGQEILQFFTRYGRVGTLTIALTLALFSWLGMKIMLLSHKVNAVSYEDLNRWLFGNRLGNGVSLLTLVMLFGVATVMLAGAGSLFAEQLKWPYQAGLLVTLLLAGLVVARGMDGIMTVNSIVVPIMLTVILIIVMYTVGAPGSGNWLRLTTDAPQAAVWSAPLLYAAYNLSLAQAVLVPLAGSIRDRDVLVWGGIIGGIGIGALLFAGHFVLSAHMPGVQQFEIPMGHIVEKLSGIIRLLFLFAIFGEIFTTFVANVYGLTLQVCQRTGLPRNVAALSVLVPSYLVSQFGFGKLVSTLYPLFGMVSLAWIAKMMWRRRPT
jgi:uncharacterized membrane protein YkvI